MQLAMGKGEEEVLNVLMRKPLLALLL